MVRWKEGAPDPMGISVKNRIIVVGLGGKERFVPQARNTKKKAGELHQMGREARVGARN